MWDPPVSPHQKQTDEQQNMNCPVYETVELNETTQNVSMSCNIAYGNFTQSSFYYILYLYYFEIQLL